MYRTVGNAALIEAAQRIAPLVRACRDEGERGRRLPAQVLAAMHEARLFRMYIPKALDGLEIDPITSRDQGRRRRKTAARRFNRASEDSEPILMFRIVARVGRGGLFGTPLSARPFALASAKVGSLPIVLKNSDLRPASSSISNNMSMIRGQSDHI
jgi:hypothetical protein